MIERTYLVATTTKHRQGNIAQTSQQANESLQELARLVETAGGTVCGQTLQTLEQVNPGTFIGSGKIEQLCEMAKRKEFDVLVFDDELKPAQLKNLTEKIPVKILDRTRVILDIFAKRARSKEGILQVELAQLSYMLPRMTQRYGDFEQQVGGIGTRGPGERKLEVEARSVRERMADLKRQINAISRHRQVARDRRHKVPLPVITLIGYTNAGKSTLLNQLVKEFGQVQEQVYADDKLFATLDPTTRRIRLPSGRWALFTDTVGFIKKLPTHLIAAFRSTLEETLDANVLLHLVDTSDAKWQENFTIVLEILQQLEKNKGRNDFSFLERMVMVYNKVDRLGEQEKIYLKQTNTHLLSLIEKIAEIEQEQVPNHLARGIAISAQSGNGLGALLKEVEDRLIKKMVLARITVPFDKMNLLPSIYRLGQVQKTEHTVKGLRLTLHLEQEHKLKLEKILK